MSRIQKGTVLTDDCGGEITVVGTSYVEINDERTDVFVSKDACCAVDDLTVWTEAEFKKEGYKVKSEVKELTVAEISKKLGYEVKVVEG